MDKKNQQGKSQKQRQRLKEQQQQQQQKKGNLNLTAKDAAPEKNLPGKRGLTS